VSACTCIAGYYGPAALGASQTISCTVMSHPRCHLSSCCVRADMIAGFLSTAAVF
jgi:hypothetical protein